MSDSGSSYQGLGCIWIPVVAIVCVTAYKIAELFAGGCP